MSTKFLQDENSCSLLVRFACAQPSQLALQAEKHDRMKHDRKSLILLLRQSQVRAFTNKNCFNGQTEYPMKWKLLALETPFVHIYRTIAQHNVHQDVPVFKIV